MTQLVFPQGKVLDLEIARLVFGYTFHKAGEEVDYGTGMKQGDKVILLFDMLYDNLGQPVGALKSLPGYSSDDAMGVKIIERMGRLYGGRPQVLFEEATWFVQFNLPRMEYALSSSFAHAVAQAALYAIKGTKYAKELMEEQGIYKGG